MSDRTEDLLLVGVGDHHNPPVVERLPNPEDLPGRLEMADVDDVERLVEENLLADLKLLHLDVGLGGHSKLAAAGEDVDGPVVVDLEDSSKVVRGGGELLHLFPEHAELLPGLLEDGRELVVLGGGPVETIPGPAQLGSRGPRCDPESREDGGVDRRSPPPAR